MSYGWSVPEPPRKPSLAARESVAFKYGFGAAVGGPVVPPSGHVFPMPSKDWKPPVPDFEDHYDKGGGHYDRDEADGFGAAFWISVLLSVVSGAASLVALL